MDNGRATLVVLLLGDPHLLECRQGRQDGAADPHGVLALGWRHNLDLHGRRRHGGDLLVDTLGDVGEHGGSWTMKNKVFFF